MLCIRSKDAFYIFKIDELSSGVMFNSIYSIEKPVEAIADEYIFVTVRRLVIVLESPDDIFVRNFHPISWCGFIVCVPFTPVEHVYGVSSQLVSVDIVKKFFGSIDLFPK